MSSSVPKLAFAVFVAATGFSNAVYAQALTSTQRTACKADYAKYCTGTTPGGGRIIACLDKQQLSEGCRKVVDAAKK
jgi:Cysteine rich repeat